MTLKLYYDLLSQPSRALYIFLKMNKIPFEKKEINLMLGEHRQKEFKKINPLSLVPVIDDNGFLLRESVGILRYLAHEKNTPDHWYPKERKAQAKVDEFLEWQHLGLRLPLAMLFRVFKVEPLLTGKPPLECDIQRFERLYKHSCNYFENVWISDEKKFLFGDKLSIADLLAAMEFEQPRITGYNPTDGRPKLAAYLNNVKTATSPYYDEACANIYPLMNSKL